MHNNKDSQRHADMIFCVGECPWGSSSRNQQLTVKSTFRGYTCCEDGASNAPQMLLRHCSPYNHSCNMGNSPLCLCASEASVAGCQDELTLLREHSLLFVATRQGQDK